MRHNVALSYAREDSAFVNYIADILVQYLGRDNVFNYLALSGLKKDSDSFFAFVDNAFEDKNKEKSIFMIVFVHKVQEGKEIEERIVVAQENELEPWKRKINERQINKIGHLKTWSVCIPNHNMSEEKLKDWSVPFKIDGFGTNIDSCNVVADRDKSSAEYVAEILLRDIFVLNPITHSSKAFTYEKDIISFYKRLLNDLRHNKCFSDDEKIRKSFNEGVPLVWPTVRRRTDKTLQKNRLVEKNKIGAPRTDIIDLQSDAQEDWSERVVVSAALSEYHDCNLLDKGPETCMIRSKLSFPEAGPRENIIRRPVNAGIVVSGGIAPGINAVIDGIVQRHKDYNRACSIYGYKYGLKALCKDTQQMMNDRITLSDRDFFQHINTAEHLSEGGSILGTFRLDRLDLPENRTLFQRVINNIAGLDVLYVIGGDGSMKAANLLSMKIRETESPVSIVGIPKTMDNDILWVWQSFGFATAVEKAREIINCLYTEVKSNPRICILQLFGSVSGFVVSHAVLSSQSGQCDAALIPESTFTISDLADHLLQRFRNKNADRDVDRTQVPWGMVVMAETAIPEDAETYIEFAKLSPEEKSAYDYYKTEKKYIDGQTTDELRSAGLKVVKAGLEQELNPHFADEVRIFTNEPRHILRATNPSFSDIINGQRLGALAVDNAMAGYSDFMVSQWLTEFVLVPLRLVSLGRKRIPQSGIFWKSVIAKTGQ